MSLAAAPLAAASEPAAAEARAQLGKHYWFRNPLEEICPQPSLRRLCTTAPASGFVVEKVAPGRSTWVRIRFDADGKTGYTRYEPGTARLSWTSEDPAAMQRRHAAVRAKYCTGGTPQLGDDQETALHAWCAPNRILTWERAGLKRERWFYKHRGYLSFANGRLVAIEKLRSSSP